MKLIKDLGMTQDRKDRRGIYKTKQTWTHHK